MFQVNGTALVISAAPILTLVLAGALLAFTDRYRRLGTMMASSALLLFGAAFVL